MATKKAARSAAVDSGDENSQPEPESGTSSGNAPDARLVCLNASKIPDLPDDFVVDMKGDSEQVVGRGESCSICIVSRKLSREHARIFPGLGKWGVEDLNSTNGVKVNGERVTSAWLKAGDEVGFGPIVFKFELEEPDVQEAPPSRPAAADAQPEAERTMVVGSDAASAAVLDAVRSVEEDVEEEKERPVKAVKRKAKPRAAPATGAAPSVPPSMPTITKATFFKRILPLGVLILAVASGFYFYPQYQRAEEVERIVASGSRVVKELVDLSRRKTGVEILNADYEDELIRLTEFLVKLERELKRDRGNVRLSALMARLSFLEFEREFITLLRNSDIDDAKALTARFLKRFEALARDLPEDAPDADTENVRDGIELLKFSDILLDFRAFATEFPTVAVDAPKKPPQARLNALRELKAKAIHYRRAHNRILSVYYLLFKNIVDNVDNTEIALFNDWQILLKKKR